MICPYCGGELRGTGIQITGTRDGFGVGREFYDHKNKKYINNWKDWEKAGFKNPLESNKLSSDMKQKIKEKVKKMPKYKNSPAVTKMEES